MAIWEPGWGLKGSPVGGPDSVCHVVVMGTNCTPPPPPAPAQPRPCGLCPTALPLGGSLHNPHLRLLLMNGAEDGAAWPGDLPARGSGTQLCPP